MEVVVAKTAGFCFGVKRAVEAVYEQLETGKTIHTYGPIVHNEEVVRELEEKGVKVIENENELCSMDRDNLQADEGTVIVRAHGVPKKTYDLITEKGLECIDATCPFVKKIHRIVQEQEKKGRRVVIAGNPDHPEVQGICGWAGEGTLVVSEASQVEKLPLLPGESLCFVAQTTFNYNKFQDLVEKFEKKGYDILVLNTICSATQERQVEASRIASEVDVMIVIGDKKSSNSQKLYEICQKKCKNTYFIQTVGDFNPECMNSVRNVGITAGASTPKQIIEEVHANARAK